MCVCVCYIRYHIHYNIFADEDDYDYYDKESPGLIQFNADPIVQNIVIFDLQLADWFNIG